MVVHEIIDTKDKTNFIDKLDGIFGRFVGRLLYIIQLVFKYEIQNII